MSIGQLAEQVEIFVVDKHRTGTHAIDADRIFFGDFDVGSFGHNLGSWFVFVRGLLNG